MCASWFFMALNTSYRLLRLKFIDLHSSRRSPLTPAVFEFSEPARSIIFKTPSKSSGGSLFNLGLQAIILSQQMQWDLLECRFKLVTACLRLEYDSLRMISTSDLLATCSSRGLNFQPLVIIWVDLFSTLRRSCKVSQCSSTQLMLTFESLVKTPSSLYLFKVSNMSSTALGMIPQCSLLSGVPLIV